MSARKKKRTKDTSDLAELVEFGGEHAKVLHPRRGHGWAGAGWYLHNEEYPDEGALFVGNAVDMAKLLEQALRLLAENNINPVDETNGDGQ